MKFFSLVFIAIFLFVIGIWFAGSQPLFFTPEKISTPEVSSKRLEANVRYLSDKLDYGKMAEVVKALYQTVLTMSKN